LICIQFFWLISFSIYLISWRGAVIAVFPSTDPQIIWKLETFICGIFYTVSCILRKEIIMPLGNLHTSRVGFGVVGSGRGDEGRGNTKNEERRKGGIVSGGTHELQYSRRIL
jgi:hypothetical protein